MVLSVVYKPQGIHLFIGLVACYVHNLLVSEKALAKILFMCFLLTADAKAGLAYVSAITMPDSSLTNTICWLLDFTAVASACQVCIKTNSCLDSSPGGRSKDDQQPYWHWHCWCTRQYLVFIIPQSRFAKIDFVRVLNIFS